MKNSNKLFKLTIFLITIIIASCTKDNPRPLIPVSEKYDDGIFVTCEGNFNSANGSLSFISDDGVVENNIFNNVNGFPLGDVVQSITIIDTTAYIVVNNSGKVVFNSKVQSIMPQKNKISFTIDKKHKFTTKILINSAGLNSHILATHIKNYKID